MAEYVHYKIGQTDTIDQTSPTPPLVPAEIGWSGSLRAYLQAIYPTGRILHGMRLGIPDAISGLTPTLSAGSMIAGDEIIGPRPSEVLSAAPVDSDRYGIYYGNKGLRYLATEYTTDPTEAETAMLAEVDPSDVLLGEISCDEIDSIQFVTQYLAYGQGRYGIRGVVNVAKNLGAGTDVTVGQFKLPADYDVLRITGAYGKTLVAGAGQQIVKHGANTLVTHLSGSMGVEGTVTIATPTAAEVTIAPIDIVVNGAAGTGVFLFGIEVQAL